jgi:DNA-binding NtrC family response regulator
LSDFKINKSKILGQALQAEISGLPSAPMLLEKAAEEGFTLAKKLRNKKNRSTEVMSPRILIVDDEEEIRQLYSDFLKGRNYQTILASGYTEMMAAIQKFDDISLVLLDLKMQEMNGLQILQKLNELKILIGIPKIICTSFASLDLVKKAKDLGASHYLVKPINFEEFILLVDKFTSWKDKV